MEQSPASPVLENLPETIPVFPLTGVLLLPGGQLPLNIFEKRYIAMVDHALSGSRMIGMIQPLPESRPQGGDMAPALHKTGCAGKITEFSETSDGRYLITLSGLCRFDVQEEIKSNTAFRQVRADWSSYERDFEAHTCLGIDRAHLHELLKHYFSKEELECDWDMIAQTSDNKLITCLSMICPLEPMDKQALLEIPCCKERSQLFMTMLEMAIKCDCKKAGNTQ